MSTPGTHRVKKHRDALRAAGMRPVQIWVPDTRQPGFTAECARQAGLVASADRQDRDLAEFMNAALDGLDDWE